MSRPESAKIPRPEPFRQWLAQALRRLDLSAYAVARDLGIGRNTVAAFLKSESAYIRLGTAALLVDHLTAEAAAAAAELPPIPEGVCDG